MIQWWEALIRRAEEPVMEQMVERVVVIDADLRARLRGLNMPLELLDETGHVLGHFTPAFRPADADELMKSCPYSEEELEQFRREPGGRTLAEIWKSLGRTG
jgi:hypothetical protein